MSGVNSRTEFAPACERAGLERVFVTESARSKTTRDGSREPCLTRAIYFAKSFGASIILVVQE